MKYLKTFEGILAEYGIEDTYEPEVVPGFEGGTIDPNDDEPWRDNGKSDKDEYEDFKKITTERNIKETKDKIIINLKRLGEDFYMSIMNRSEHYKEFLNNLLLGMWVSDGYVNILTDEKYEGIIEKIYITYDDYSSFPSFKLKGQPEYKHGFCQEYITLDKMKSTANKYNL